ncbi:ribbon-helix-helix protein, CopG family [Janthinobacterium sp. SUN120]|uniref:ribbon-helix-helix protein, CopG family n=1 Tax=Janthinobacterium sp. SUN120 TaxID=3004099 RepID=UPI0025B08BDC|nr:ribbon-helix-helix protein, CopG family [Janthinobacterium sp. SUN120]MDN2713482.1 ribbon-helix-helix protein, CopG family [Janthinobacterium sp. SUN120]
MNNLSKVGRLAKGVTSRPLGVRLTPDEVAEVEAYAEKLDRSRAWFLRFLILRGLADFKRELASNLTH